MSPALFLGMVAVAFGVIALLLSLSAYAGVRSLTKKNEEAAEKAIRAENRNLSMVFYMDDASQDTKDPREVQSLLTKLGTRVLTTLLMALWREGVITADRMIQLQPLAQNYLEQMYPGTFPQAWRTEAEAGARTGTEEDEDEER